MCVITKRIYFVARLLTFSRDIFPWRTKMQHKDTHTLKGDALVSDFRSFSLIQYIFKSLIIVQSEEHELVLFFLGERKTKQFHFFSLFFFFCSFSVLYYFIGPPKILQKICDESSPS